MAFHDKDLERNLLSEYSEAEPYHEREDQAANPLERANVLLIPQSEPTPENHNFSTGEDQCGLIYNPHFITEMLILQFAAITLPLLDTPPLANNPQSERKVSNASDAYWHEQVRPTHDPLQTYYTVKLKIPSSDNQVKIIQLKTHRLSTFIRELPERIQLEVAKHCASSAEYSHYDYDENDDDNYKPPTHLHANPGDYADYNPDLDAPKPRQVTEEKSSTDKPTHRVRNTMLYLQAVGAKLNCLDTLFVGLAFLSANSLTPTLLRLINLEPDTTGSILGAADGFLTITPIPPMIYDWHPDSLKYIGGGAYAFIALALGVYALTTYHRTTHTPNAHARDALMDLTNRTPAWPLIAQGPYFFLSAASKVLAINLCMTLLHAAIPHDVIDKDTTQAALRRSQWVFSGLFALTTVIHQYVAHNSSPFEEHNDKKSKNPTAFLNALLNFSMQTAYHAATTAFLSVAAYRALVCQNAMDCHHAGIVLGLNITSAVSSALYVIGARDLYHAPPSINENDYEEYNPNDDSSESSETSPNTDERRLLKQKSFDAHSDDSVELDTSPNSCEHNKIAWPLIKWASAACLLMLYGGFDFKSHQNPFTKWHGTLIPALSGLAHILHIPEGLKMRKASTQEFGGALQSLGLALVMPLWTGALYGIFDAGDETENPITLGFLGALAGAILASYTLTTLWKKTQTHRKVSLSKKVSAALETQTDRVNNTVGTSTNYNVLKDNIDSTRKLALENPGIKKLRDRQKKNLWALRYLDALGQYKESLDDDPIPRDHAVQNIHQKADKQTRHAVKLKLFVDVFLIGPGLLAQFFDNTGYRGLVAMSVPVALFMYKPLYDHYHLRSLQAASEHEHYQESSRCQVFTATVTQSNFWKACCKPSARQANRDDTDEIAMEQTHLGQSQPSIQ